MKAFDKWIYGVVLPEDVDDATVTGMRSAFQAALRETREVARKAGDLDDVINFINNELYTVGD